MINSRLIGFPLLLAAAACASAHTNTRAALEPQNGPRARVYVRYAGGLTDRTVRTTFSTTTNAHVIVARLGGDGRVEVLYPETPSSPTLVQGGETYQAQPFDASFDAIPRLFSYATRMPRSYGARMSSYDGYGNGFVFVIATQYPMFTDALDDHGQWSDSLEAEGYNTDYDPRVSIKDFAEVLTRGMPYSLDYADAFTTTSFSGFADAAIDCSNLIRTFGLVGTYYNLRMLGAISPWSNFSPFAPFMFGMSDWYSPYAGCGFTQDRRLAFGYGRGFPGVNGGNMLWYARNGGTANYPVFPWEFGEYPTWTPRGVTPITTVTVNPPEPVAPRGFSTAARRPGFRNGDESGSAISVTRPRFDGQRNKPTTSSWAPPIQQTRTYVDRNDHYERSNGSGSSSSGATGVTRTEGLTSHQPSAPVAAPAPSLPVSHPVSKPVKPGDP